MNLEEMRRLDAAKTYKELEEAKKSIDDLELRVKHDFETILKFKAENEHLTKKIQQLYEGAEEQKQRIHQLEYAGHQLLLWLDRNTPVTVRNDWLAAKEAKP